MRLVEPVVIKIAETAVDQVGVESMLEHLGAMKWWKERSAELWGSTLGAEMVIELAGRTCYKSFGLGLNPNITKIRTDRKDYFENILKKGDGSILEHGTVTFALLGVSRVFTHELVRHRVGVAYSQESLRYVRVDAGQLPITDVGNYKEMGNATVDSLFAHTVKSIENAYHDMAGNYNWEHMTFDQKKRLTSFLRRILPQGMATNIIFTANHRTLRWLIEMRTDPAAEVEIRRVFGKIAKICIKDFPLIYQDFKETELADGTSMFKPELRSKV